jgi:hypothetical protein
LLSECVHAIGRWLAVAVLPYLETGAEVGSFLWLPNVELFSALALTRTQRMTRSDLADLLPRSPIGEFVLSWARGEFDLVCPRPVLDGADDGGHVERAVAEGFGLGEEAVADVEER